MVFLRIEPGHQANHRRIEGQIQFTTNLRCSLRIEAELLEIKSIWNELDFLGCVANSQRDAIPDCEQETIRSGTRCDDQGAGANNRPSRYGFIVLHPSPLL